MSVDTLPQPVRVGPLEVRPDERVVLANGRPMTLSVQEYRVLCVFAACPGRVITREELYRAGWGATLRPGDRSVDVYVRKLRVKLGRAMPGYRWIHTHFGFGYRFGPEPSPGFHTVATGR